MRSDIRLALIAGIAVVAVVAALLVDPVAQDPAYHDFADQRAIAGVPNFWNVASNLPFGHRVGHGPVVRSFYRRLLPELARVLRPGGRAALLTSRRRWLGRFLPDNPKLHPDRRLRLILGGKEAYIFLLSRAH